MFVEFGIVSAKVVAKVVVAVVQGKKSFEGAIVVCGVDGLVSK